MLTHAPRQMNGPNPHQPFAFLVGSAVVATVAGLTARSGGYATALFVFSLMLAGFGIWQLFFPNSDR